MPFNFPRKQEPVYKDTGQLIKEAAVATGFNVLGGLVQRGANYLITGSDPATEQAKSTQWRQSNTLVGQFTNFMDSSAKSQAAAMALTQAPHDNVIEAAKQIQKSLDKSLEIEQLIQKGRSVSKDHEAYLDSHGLARFENRKKEYEAVAAALAPSLKKAEDLFREGTPTSRERGVLVLAQANSVAAKMYAELGYQALQRGLRTGLLEKKTVLGLEKAIKPYNASVLALSEQLVRKAGNIGNRPWNPQDQKSNVVGSPLPAAIPRGRGAFGGGWDEAYVDLPANVHDYYRTAYAGPDNKGKAAKGAVSWLRLNLFGEGRASQISPFLQMTPDAEAYFDFSTNKQTKRVGLEINKDLKPEHTLKLINDGKVTLFIGMRDSAAHKGTGPIAHLQDWLASQGYMEKVTGGARGVFGRKTLAGVNKAYPRTNGFVNQKWLRETGIVDQSSGLSREHMEAIARVRPVATVAGEGGGYDIPKPVREDPDTWTPSYREYISASHDLREEYFPEWEEFRIQLNEERVANRKANDLPEPSRDAKWGEYSSDDAFDMRKDEEWYREVRLPQIRAETGQPIAPTTAGDPDDDLIVLTPHRLPGETLSDYEKRYELEMKGPLVPEPFLKDVFSGVTRARQKEREEYQRRAAIPQEVHRSLGPIPLSEVYTKTGREQDITLGGDRKPLGGDGPLSESNLASDQAFIPVLNMDDGRRLVTGASIRVREDGLLVDEKSGNKILGRNGKPIEVDPSLPITLSDNLEVIQDYPDASKVRGIIGQVTVENPEKLDWSVHSYAVTEGSGPETGANAPFTRGQIPNPKRLEDFAARSGRTKDEIFEATWFAEYPEAPPSLAGLQVEVTPETEKYFREMAEASQTALAAQAFPGGLNWGGWEEMGFEPFTGKDVEGLEPEVKENINALANIAGGLTEELSAEIERKKIIADVARTARLSEPEKVQLAMVKAFEGGKDPDLRTVQATGLVAQVYRFDPKTPMRFNRELTDGLDKEIKDIREFAEGKAEERRLALTAFSNHIMKSPSVDVATSRLKRPQEAASVGSLMTALIATDDDIKNLFSRIASGKPGLEKLVKIGEALENRIKDTEVWGNAAFDEVIIDRLYAKDERFFNIDPELKGIYNDTSLDERGKADAMRKHLAGSEGEKLKRTGLKMYAAQAFKDFWATIKTRRDLTTEFGDLVIQHEIPRTFPRDFIDTATRTFFIGLVDGYGPRDGDTTGLYNARNVQEMLFDFKDSAIALRRNTWKAPTGITFQNYEYSDTIMHNNFKGGARDVLRGVRDMIGPKGKDFTPETYLKILQIGRKLGQITRDNLGITSIERRMLRQQQKR